MKRENLGNTKNNLSTYVDMESSHATTHFVHHPKLIEAVKKIIPTLDIKEDSFREQFDTGEMIGTTDLVETTDRDEIVYAMRPLRQVYSRFVKNKKSVPTSWITIDLRKANETEYYLYTAFVGKLTPSFPGGNYLPEQSNEFWSKHALVWESQDVVPGTETTECPW